MQEHIGALGPRIVTEYPDSDVMEEKLQEMLERVYKVSNRIKLKNPIRIQPAPARHDGVGLPDITRQGTMTAQPRLRLREKAGDHEARPIPHSICQGRTVDNHWLSAHWRMRLVRQRHSQRRSLKTGNTSTPKSSK